MRNLLIIVFAFFLGGSSCNKPLIPNKAEIHLRGKEDVAEINLIGNDTLRHYFDDGTLGGITPYRDGKKHGKEVWYYSSGYLEKTVEYEDGGRYGDTKAYYENGIQSEDLYYYDDVPVGNAHFQHSNSMPSAYRSFDFEGCMRYIRKYDEKGKLLKVEGTALGQVAIIKKGGDTLKLAVSYARPTGTHNKVSAKVYRNGVEKEEKVLLKTGVGILMIYDFSAVDSVLFIGELEDFLFDQPVVKDSLVYVNPH